jgi:hypothetical protein
LNMYTPYVEITPCEYSGIKLNYYKLFYQKILHHSKELYDICNFL